MGVKKCIELRFGRFCEAGHFALARIVDQMVERIAVPLSRQSLLHSFGKFLKEETSVTSS